MGQQQLCEDVVELHCHGGQATVNAVLGVLSRQKGCRIAEAGEFSRRAFENNKLDLTELEGLSDLIAAQTESQRKLALRQSEGSLRALYDDWRDRLINCRALIEAEIDFADEDDVPGSVSNQVWTTVTALREELFNHLDDQNIGEIVRDGFKVALLGPPNSGKSSLINALANRDIAIVTPIAGTTRDALEVSLDIDGLQVIVTDTAGIHETEDIVEQEGIKRSRLAAENANLVLWLTNSKKDPMLEMPANAVLVQTKSDLGHSVPNAQFSINTVTSDGLSEITKYLKQQVAFHNEHLEQPLVTRHRHRAILLECEDHLKNSLRETRSLDIRSEHLRLASDSLGKITGRIDVEDLLDVIFSEFCIGK